MEEDFFLRFFGDSEMTGGGDLCLAAERVFLAGESGGDKAVLLLAFFDGAVGVVGGSDGRLCRHHSKPLLAVLEGNGGGGVITTSLNLPLKIQHFAQ